MNKKKLIVPVGLPRCGKSTLARMIQAQFGASIVCPDDIRLAVHGKPFIKEDEAQVWCIANHMLKTLLRDGNRPVVFDATNLTRALRLSNFFEFKDDVDITLFSVSTSKELCIARAEATNQKYLIPIIERMDQQLEPPSPEEFGSVVHNLSGVELFLAQD